MKNAEMVQILIEQQQFIERLTSRVGFLEEELRNIVTDNSNPQIYSNTLYLGDHLRNSPHNCNNSIDNEHYNLYTFNIGSWKLGTMDPHDLEQFINEVTRLRKQMSNLGDLEMLRENIYKMATEADQMQADMVRIINEEGNKAVNKIKDLASRTDTTTIDNKDLILDKDN